MSATLYIAAKAPRVGFAKTRLGRQIGQPDAVALYQGFLRDLAARFAAAPFAVGWYVTPEDAWPEIAASVGWHGPTPRVVVQGDGDWTARQRQLFRDAPARGEDQVILIGSDSPQISVQVVADAFRQLDRRDLVFGPVYDGGYYLIGMRGWHDVFEGVAMSTSTVLEDLIARAHEAGLSVGLVEATFDVDELADLRHLVPTARARSDLPATRAALVALGRLEPCRPASDGIPELPTEWR